MKRRIHFDPKPAECLERRTLAARNTIQTAMTATQSAGQVDSGLSRVRQAAQRDRKLRFNNLLHHVTPQLLLEAYGALNHKAAAGVDEADWYEYGNERLHEKLRELHQKIQRGVYKPQPSKRIWIPKEDGSERAIGIASIEDKIAQQALVKVLESIYEIDFMGFSYGFRPGRSTHSALDAVYVAITQNKVNWVLDADIKGFFDNIDHEWLLLFLEHRVADRRVLDLCIKMLRAGIEDKGQWSPSTIGAAQGGVVSPLFANVFLHYVLDLWVHQWRRKHARGECYIVRYADDFVMGFQYKSDGERLKQALGNRLGNFGLSLHEKKTKLIEFGRFAKDNRQRRGEGKPETFNFLGFTHYCSQTREKRLFKLGRKTISQKQRKKLKQIKINLMRNRFQHTAVQAAYIRSLLLGHFNYFGVPGNLQMMDQFRREVCRFWFRALRKRSQKARKLGWEKMRKLIKRYLPSVRTVHPYPTQRFGV